MTERRKNSKRTSHMQQQRSGQLQRGLKACKILQRFVTSFSRCSSCSPSPLKIPQLFHFTFYFDIDLHMNYFELFGIPVSIRINKSTLAEKYFEIQKKYHPDFYAQGTEAEQSDALEQSSAANKALKTFKSEDETIKYVLQLKGLLQEEEKYQLPPEFLMEMMELNEDLTNNSVQQVVDLEASLYNDIAPIIENYDDTSISNKELLRLKEYYFKKKYLHRILDRISG